MKKNNQVSTKPSGTGREKEAADARAAFPAGPKMKELPAQEQPYERCLEAGAESLTDAQLLAAILRTGSTGESALALSRRILALPGYSGLTGLCRLSAPDLMGIRGIGRTKAAQILCITELSRRIAREHARGKLSFHDPMSVAS